MDLMCIHVFSVSPSVFWGHLQKPGYEFHISLLFNKTLLIQCNVLFIFSLCYVTFHSTF